MLAALLKIQPTRINREYVGGPLYHWDRITEAQLRELDVMITPGHRAGNIARAPGITVRRLKDGCVNVIAESTSPSLRSRAFRRLMDRLLSPAPDVVMDAAPRLSLPVYSPAMEAMAMDGQVGRWELDLRKGEFVLAKSAIDLVATIAPDVKARISYQAYLRHLGPEGEKVRVAFEAAISAKAPLDVTFRRSRAGFVRMAGAVVRNDAGEPIRVVGVASVMKYLETAAEPSSEV